MTLCGGGLSWAHTGHEEPPRRYWRRLPGPTVKQGRHDGWLPGPETNTTEYQAMNSRSGTSELTNAVPIETAREHITELTARIGELQKAISGAKSQAMRCTARKYFAFCAVGYFGIARFLRGITTSVFDWRWAGVLIGATLLGGILSVATLSWAVGLYGASLSLSRLRACSTFLPIVACH